MHPQLMTILAGQQHLYLRGRRAESEGEGEEHDGRGHDQPLPVTGKGGTGQRRQTQQTDEDGGPPRHGAMAAPGAHGVESQTSPHRRRDRRGDRLGRRRREDTGKKVTGLEEVQRAEDEQRPTDEKGGRATGRERGGDFGSAERLADQPYRGETDNEVIEGLETGERDERDRPRAAQGHGEQTEIEQGGGRPSVGSGSENPPAHQ